MKKKDFIKTLMCIALVLQLLILLYNFFNLNDIDYDMIYSNESVAWDNWDRVIYMYGSMSLYRAGLILNSVILILGCFVFYKYCKTGTANASLICSIGLMSFVTNPLSGILWFITGAKFLDQKHVTFWAKRLLITSIILIGISPILRLLAIFLILIEQPIINTHLSSFDSLILPAIWVKGIMMVISRVPELVPQLLFPFHLVMYISSIILGVISLYKKIGSKEWKILIIITFIFQSFIMNLSALLTLSVIILVFMTQRNKKPYVLDYDI